MARVKVGLVYAFFGAALLGSLFWLPYGPNPCHRGTVEALFTPCKVIENPTR